MSARKLGCITIATHEKRSTVDDVVSVTLNQLDLEALVERAAIAGRKEMHRQAPGFDWQGIARQILALVEKEARR